MGGREHGCGMKEILCSKIESQQVISKVGESGNCNRNITQKDEVK